MNDGTVLVGLGATPIITALLQVVKPLVPPRLIQLAAVVLGVAWNCGTAWANGDLTGTTPFIGVMAGLAASGLYSGSRALLNGKTGG